MTKKKKLKNIIGYLVIFMLATAGLIASALGFSSGEHGYPFPFFVSFVLCFCGGYRIFCFIVKTAMMETEELPDK